MTEIIHAGMEEYRASKTKLLSSSQQFDGFCSNVINKRDRAYWQMNNLNSVEFHTNFFSVRNRLKIFIRNAKRDFKTSTCKYLNNSHTGL